MPPLPSRKAPAPRSVVGRSHPRRWSDRARESRVRSRPHFPKPVLWILEGAANPTRRPTPPPRAASPSAHRISCFCSSVRPAALPLPCGGLGGSGWWAEKEIRGRGRKGEKKGGRGGKLHPSLREVERGMRSKASRTLSRRAEVTVFLYDCGVGGRGASRKKSQGEQDNGSHIPLRPYGGDRP